MHIVLKNKGSMVLKGLLCKLQGVFVLINQSFKRYISGFFFLFPPHQT